MKSRIRNVYNNTPEVKEMNCKLLVFYNTAAMKYVNADEVELFTQEYTTRLAIATKAVDYQQTLIYLVYLCRDYISLKIIRKHYNPGIHNHKNYLNSNRICGRRKRYGVGVKDRHVSFKGPVPIFRSGNLEYNNESFEHVGNKVESS